MDEHRLNHNQNHTRFYQPENKSLFTNTSSQLLNFQKISLNSCSSSISLVQHEGPSKSIQERKLVMKLLHQKHKNQIQKLLCELTTHYEMIEKDQKIETNCDRYPFSYFPSQYQQTDKKILNYYFFTYLKEMGYRSQRNKKHILERGKLILSIEGLPKVVKFYETFGVEHLKTEERFRLLKGTCIYGWEYFIIEMCKTLKTKTWLKVQQD